MVVCHQVLIIIAFIVLAPLMGALLPYLISIWFINASRKNYLSKLFTIGLIATVWFVYNK
jgi:PiT family inorganic phosphate transporter